MMKDISWGSIILGAAAVTAIAAVGLGTGGMLLPLAEVVTSGGVLTGAAVAGGALGNMVSKLLHRTQDAATTLVQR